jgi:hypothetical protein
VLSISISRLFRFRGSCSSKLKASFRPKKPLRHWCGTKSSNFAAQLLCLVVPGDQVLLFLTYHPCANAFAVEKLTVASMRKLSAPASSFFRWKSFVVNTHRLIVRGPHIPALQQLLPSRHLAQVRTEPLSEVWFTPASPRRSPADDLLGYPGNGSDHKPPDDRILKLGKSEQSF